MPWTKLCYAYGSPHCSPPGTGGGYWKKVSSNSLCHVVFCSTRMTFNMQKTISLAEKQAHLGTLKLFATLVVGRNNMSSLLLMGSPLNLAKGRLPNTGLWWWRLLTNGSWRTTGRLDVATRTLGGGRLTLKKGVLLRVLWGNGRRIGRKGSSSISLLISGSAAPAAAANGSVGFGSTETVGGAIGGLGVVASCFPTFNNIFSYFRHIPISSNFPCGPR